MTGNTVPEPGGQEAPGGGREPGPGGALGTSGNRDTPPHPSRQSKRASRHRLKAVQRELTEGKAGRFCWYALGAAAAVELGRQLTAHVSAVQRCGSPWACPVCAPVVRERRAGDIDRGLRAHLDAGGGAVFVTHTVQHHQGDELAGRLHAVSRALWLSLQGAGWQRRRKSLGYVGSIKAVEITHGRNGWHPHAHSLLLFDRPLSGSEIADLRAFLRSRWSLVVTRHGYGELHREHGVDVQPVGKAGELAGYLTKVEGGWGAGLELARGDVKKARGGVTPVQLLRQFAETGDARALQLWREYEAATFGRRAIVWSPGLRARLLDDQEVSDAEAAAGEGADVTLLRALVPALQWRQLLKAGATGELLTELEGVGALLLTCSDVYGHHPPALE